MMTIKETYEEAVKSFSDEHLEKVADYLSEEVGISAPENVREAYRELQEALEKYICAIEEMYFNYGYRASRAVLKHKRDKKEAAACIQ